MVQMVSLSDKAYSILKNIKGRNESFSDIVLKLVETPKKADIMELAGAWKDMDEMDSIFHDILDKRRKYKGRARVDL